MLGADYYETDSEISYAISKGKVPIGIGENTRIRYNKYLPPYQYNFLCTKFSLF